MNASYDSDLSSRARMYKIMEWQGAWQQGDLAIEVVELWGEDGLTELARQTGRTLKVVMARYLVAKAYPHEMRHPTIPWSVHYRFMDQDDRSELLNSPPSGGWTYVKAANLVGQRALAAAAATEGPPAQPGEEKIIGGRVYRRGPTQDQLWKRQLAAIDKAGNSDHVG